MQLNYNWSQITRNYNLPRNKKVVCIVWIHNLGLASTILICWTSLACNSSTILLEFATLPLRLTNFICLLPTWLLYWWYWVHNSYKPPNLLYTCSLVFTGSWSFSCLLPENLSFPYRMLVPTNICCSSHWKFCRPSIQLI